MKKLDKYIWIFAEWCLNLPLLQMASDRNDKISKIRSKSEIINEHLFKWYLMPRSRDCDHWLREIDDRFYEIENLTWGKKRRFYEEEYFNFIYHDFYTKDFISVYYRKLNRVFSKIEDKYSTEYHREFEMDDFVENVGIIIKEISSLLAADNYDFDKLKEMVNKYLR